MSEKVKISPYDKFVKYRDKFESDYTQFLQLINENIREVDVQTERLNCSIIPLDKDIDRLKNKMENEYNYTNMLIEMLAPMCNQQKIKHLHFYVFEKDFANFIKHDSNTYNLIKNLYTDLALATRWEGAILHYSHIDKNRDLKWTNSTIDKVSKDRIDLMGKNNSKHSLFRSTLERRVGKEAK